MLVHRIIAASNSYRQRQLYSRQEPSEHHFLFARVRAARASHHITYTALSCLLLLCRLFDRRYFTGQVPRLLSLASSAAIPSLEALTDGRVASVVPKALLHLHCDTSWNPYQRERRLFWTSELLLSQRWSLHKNQYIYFRTCVSERCSGRKETSWCDPRRQTSDNQAAKFIPLYINP